MLDKGYRVAINPLSRMLKGALARPVHRKSRRLKNESAISRLSYRTAALETGDS
jgi:hypothetical protein